jgi:hypothetical protein
MTDVSVDCRPVGEGWSCQVRVSEPGSTTEHEVSVSRAELERFAPGADEPQVLVRESIGYLLEREPKEAILRRFELRVIERYFPSYPSDIVRRLGA